MRHSFLDRYSRLDSIIHRVPFGIKVVVTLAIIFAAVTGPDRSVVLFAALFAFLVVVAAITTIPPLYLLRRMVILELVVATVAVLSLFREDGAHIFLVLFVRSSICLLAIVLFTNTTPFSQMLKGLRSWRVPSLLLSILALLYRYIFILIDEMERMQRARASRTFTKNRSAVRSSFVTVVAQSFVRSAERAERIFAAMEARGWK